jgi:hypothetical protein
MTNVATAGLVGALFDGPIDVVGDVHGELRALHKLLTRLGYNRHGEHPQGRRLIFIGDLCDRGPDSPGVIALVRRLVERDLAQCVAGNHELNVLRRKEKDGNHWFFGKSRKEGFGQCVPIEQHEQAAIHEFFNSLPVVLERHDLRLVHAAWDAEAVEKARRSTLGVLEFYFAEEKRIDIEVRATGLKEANARDWERYGDCLRDKEATVPFLENIGRYDEIYQMGNSIKVTTSGVERVANCQFFAGGRWRMTKRVPWWQEYQGQTPVLFGHYWRWLQSSSHALYCKGQPPLFDGIPPKSWLPTKDEERAFCLDYSVGNRFKERMEKRQAKFHGQLAAMRWPERELVFDEEV